jgi:hypothetical protein
LYRWQRVSIAWWSHIWMTACWCLIFIKSTFISVSLSEHNIQIKCSLRVWKFPDFDFIYFYVFIFLSFLFFPLQDFFFLTDWLFYDMIPLSYFPPMVLDLSIFVGPWPFSFCPKVWNFSKQCVPLIISYFLNLFFHFVLSLIPLHLPDIWVFHILGPFENILIVADDFSDSVKEHNIISSGSFFYSLDEQISIWHSGSGENMVKGNLI